MLHKPVQAIAVNTNPAWYAADSSCFFKSGVAGAFDEIAVKDPSIVCIGGKYHLFYTGVDNRGWWQLGYASAASIGGLGRAAHIYLTSLKENYYCAPQVFYFEPQRKWYLIYQDGNYAAAYATTETIDDPDSWKGPLALGIPRPTGYDFWIICDHKHAYAFYTPDGNTRTITWRRTSLKNFPAGWGAPNVAASGTLEAVCVYKCLADDRYYMLPENFHGNRYYEMWTAARLDGSWNKICDKWISESNLVSAGKPWTTIVSHGEIIRAGISQRLEIADINRIDFLFQGAVNPDSYDYAQIPWDLGVIRNYRE